MICKVGELILCGVREQVNANVIYLLVTLVDSAKHMQATSQG